MADILVSSALYVKNLGYPNFLFHEILSRRIKNIRPNFKNSIIPQYSYYERASLLRYYILAL